MPDSQTYPEHEKLHALEGKNNLIGDFVEWLREQPDLTVGLWRPHYCLACEAPWQEDEDGYCLSCGRGPVNKSEQRLLPAHISTEQLLARYFDVDLNRLQAEKQLMLEKLREANHAR